MVIMNRDLETYYKERAKEYEKIYLKPERQENLREMESILKEIFAGRELIEIACGTGYWTEIIAETASEILATDINSAVLKIAKNKDYKNAKVTVREADFNKIKSPGNHESLFGGFIWSHIKIQELPEFINLVKGQVVKDGIAVFIDNTYVKGSSTPISLKDKAGNTYQNRTLDNGKDYLVLKNFPTEKFIKKLLKGKAEDIRFIRLKYYWTLIFRNT